MLLRRAPQFFRNPAVKAFSGSGGFQHNPLVQFRSKAHVKAAEVRLFGLFSFLGAKFKIILNGIREACFNSSMERP